VQSICTNSVVLYQEVCAVAVQAAIPPHRELRASVVGALVTGCRGLSGSTQVDQPIRRVIRTTTPQDRERDLPDPWNELQRWMTTVLWELNTVPGCYLVGDR